MATRHKPGPLEQATTAAVRHARAQGILAPNAKHDPDIGVITAMKALARKIDMQDVYFRALADDAAERNGRPPAQDNVSLPTYLKFAESLGLSPGGRKAFNAANKKANPGASKASSAHAGRDELAERRGWRTA